VRSRYDPGRGTEIMAPVKSRAEYGHSPTLHAVGMCRWDTLSRFVPISRESWRKLVNACKAPKPVKLSERCTMYANAEVHKWLAEPAAYVA
jgi:prophage regulatory protein